MLAISFSKELPPAAPFSAPRYFSGALRFRGSEHNSPWAGGEHSDHEGANSQQPKLPADPQFLQSKPGSPKTRRGQPGGGPPLPARFAPPLARRAPPRRPCTARRQDSSPLKPTEPVHRLIGRSDPPPKAPRRPPPPHPGLGTPAQK